MGSSSIDMRVLMFATVLLSVCIFTCEAQKGGAKSAMRNRGKSGGRGGGSRGGGARSGGDDGGGGSRYSSARVDSDKPKPCIGLCYLRKLKGQDPLPVLKREAPCIGLCYLKKLKEFKSRSVD